MVFKNLPNRKELFEIFLRNRNSVNKESYKTFTPLFKSIKQKSKKNYYHNLLITNGNDIKGTWVTIKEIIKFQKID